MANVLKIYKSDDPILRTKCREIDRVESWVMDLANDMWMTMLASKAIGLAANQVGFDYRMITIKGDQFEGVMINPIIINHSKEVFHFEEGCLSIPGYGFDTGKRSKVVQIEYFDLIGVKNSVTFSDMTAVIAQHEIDHLDAIMMVDYMESGMAAKK
jgi:peptide deformylase